MELLVDIKACLLLKYPLKYRFRSSSKLRITLVGFFFLSFLPWNRFEPLVPLAGLFDSFAPVNILLTWLGSIRLPFRLRALGDLAISKDSFKADRLLLVSAEDDNLRLLLFPERIDWFSPWGWKFIELQSVDFLSLLNIWSFCLISSCKFRLNSEFRFCKVRISFLWNYINGSDFKVLVEFFYGFIFLFQFAFMLLNDGLKFMFESNVNFDLVLILSDYVLQSRVLLYADFAAVQHVSKS